MDPTVAAAAIGVGGTVIVGVAGFGAAIWSTRRTIASAREDRVWNQRAQVYADAIAAVQYRQAVRDVSTRTSAGDAHDEQLARSYIASYQEPSWVALNGRLLAFAHRDVVRAMGAATDVHNLALEAFESWHRGGAAQAVDAAQPVDEARKAADTADAAVVDLIRKQLLGRG